MVAFVLLWDETGLISYNLIFTSYYIYHNFLPLACRGHFSLQSYCLDELSSTAMLTDRRLNDNFPQIIDLGISLTLPSVSLTLSPLLRSPVSHEK